MKIIFKIHTTIIVLVILLCASACTHHNSSITLRTVTQSPCLIPLPADENEGESLSCGTVDVPENYDLPDAKHIPLSFVLLKSTGNQPVSAPVIFLHGGPGSGELIALTQFIEDFSTIRQKHDVLIFDQRGAGFSNDPLDCGLDLIRQGNEIQDSMSEALPENKGRARQESILAVCLNTAKKHDIDLTQYNSINNAYDVQSIAAAFGFNTFNLYGHSYGTKLALEVMRQQPAGLQSVILDSVTPPNVRMYEQSSKPTVDAALALFNTCAADESCDNAYPDLLLRFNRLMLTLKEQPIALIDDQPITPEMVVALFKMRNNRYGRTGISAYLPRMIAELEQGISSTYIGLRDESLLPPSPFENDAFINDENEIVQKLTLAQKFNIAANSTNSIENNPVIKSAYFDLPQQPATIENLRSFLNQYLQSTDRDVLLKMVDDMKNTDVAELHIEIHQSVAYQPNSSIATILFPLHLFTCNESMPFNTMEGARAYINSAPIPSMTLGAEAAALNSIKLCKGFPTGTVDSSFHEPVASDIPTLVLVGLNDTQTAPDWGQIAISTLSNAYMAEFPESGHGVFQFSQCARDMAVNFFKNPDIIPDMTCRKELQTKFILP